MVAAPPSIDHFRPVNSFQSRIGDIYFEGVGGGVKRGGGVTGGMFLLKWTTMGRVPAISHFILDI